MDGDAAGASDAMQLVGALGGWLAADPPEGRELSVATRLVLDGSLLGVRLNDFSAPELVGLDDEQRHIVEQARSWGMARQAEQQRERAERDQPEAAERRRRQRERERAAERTTEADSAANVPAQAPSSPPQRVSPPPVTAAPQAARRSIAPKRPAATAPLAAPPALPAAAPPRPPAGPKPGGEAQTGLPLSGWLGNPEPAAAPTRSGFRPTEELVWWAVCAVAITVLFVLQFV